jgi:hypothetical protein
MSRPGVRGRRVVLTTLLLTVTFAAAHAGPVLSRPLRAGQAAAVPSVPPKPRITGVTIDRDQHVVTFRFSSTGPTSGFTCALGPRGTAPPSAGCRSPVSYTKLHPGVYEFTVQAVDPAGTQQGSATKQLTVPIEFSNCWGAASRDPRHRCFNPALTNVVVPTPDNVLLQPPLSGYCTVNLTNAPSATLCGFGVGPSVARGNVAIIGDSHAAAWLPALQYAAIANRWHGLAYIHNGCGVSTALISGYSPADRDRCQTWVHDVLSWLGQHPELTTLVITGRDERGWLSSAAVGFHQAWQAIPSSVRRIFIIRDVPHSVLSEPDCVTQALTRHQPAGTRCAQPRSRTIVDDREADAALSSGSPRVHLLDFTPFFCDKHRCFPVVGGALVYWDMDHMSHEFAPTLGPYLRRSINAIK